MFVPSCAFLRIFRWNLRSFFTSFHKFIGLLCLAVYINCLRQLMKCFAGDITSVACHKHSITVSSSLIVMLFLVVTMSIPMDQALNFSKENEMSSALVSSFQPRRVLFSSSAASAWSFDINTRSRLFIESLGSTGFPIVKIASNAGGATGG